MKQDVSFLVERLPEHEHRCGIRFEGLHAELEQLEGLPTLTIRAEMHENGHGLASSIDVRANAYDQSGRVIGTGSFFVDDNSFFGFETVEIYLMDLAERPSKVRLYPKSS